MLNATDDYRTNMPSSPKALKSDRSSSLLLEANVKMIPIHKRPETTFCLNEKFWYPEGQSSTWAVIQGTMSHQFLLFFFYDFC